MACEYGERTRFDAKTRQRELNGVLAPRRPTIFFSFIIDAQPQFTLV